MKEENSYNIEEFCTRCPHIKWSIGFHRKMVCREECWVAEIFLDTPMKNRNLETKIA